MKKVVIDSKRIILDDFFKIEEAQLQFELFHGEMSVPVRRLSLERGDSAAVVIFNRDTQKIILINQFRYPTYKNGPGWVTEIIAGMVDEGETPEESVRRELLEEAGLTISSVEHICDFYPSPGGSSERIFLYYAEVSGKFAVYNKTGGLPGHGEDIRTMEITLEEALHNIKTGEIVDAKTILGILWTENRRLKRQE